MNEKMIIHVDGDSFFASCEIALDPKLKGKPVVTGHERGIASAMSQEAKALGIYRGMPIFQIKKLFPQAVIVTSNYYNYGVFAERMYNIVGRYTDLVHEYSIDECFADITGLDTLYGCSYEDLAWRIKNDLKRELGITFSVGLAPTKVLAKVASKWQKPDGFTVIYKNQIPDFLKKVSIGKVWGIGPETAAHIRSLGIETAYEFIQKSKNYIESNLSKPFLDTWYELQGVPIHKIDNEPQEDQKSVQSTRTFTPATADKSFLLSQLSKNAEEACARARDLKLLATKIHYFLKTSTFTYKRLEIPLTNSLAIPNEIMKIINNTFDTVYSKRNLYRSTGITLAGLIPSHMTADDLFGSFKALDRWNEVFGVVDKLDRRFGSNSVVLAESLKAFKKENSGTENKKIIIDKKLRMPFMGEVE